MLRKSVLLCKKVTTKEKEFLAADFVRQAHQRWGNRYDYSEARQTLKHFYAKIGIICSSHGRFFTLPKFHLAGEGCPKCNRRDETREEQWKQRALAMRQESIGRLLPGRAPLSIGAKVPEIT